MSEGSHLYPGFRFAGALASVAVQRRWQAQLLGLLLPKRLLIVGSGYGEEANVLVEGCWPEWTDGRPRISVTLTDIVDVRSTVLAQSSLRRLGEATSFERLDITSLAQLDGFGGFDVVQCGFVLHDVVPCEKDRAIKQLADAASPGGHVIVSEIFSRPGRAATMAQDVYDGFLQEATEALALRRLSCFSFHELVGDGAKPGLRRSRQEAVEQNRDYFETIPRMVQRATRVGLELISVFQNPVHEYLAVLVFRRRTHVARHVAEGELRYGV